MTAPQKSQAASKKRKRKTSEERVAELMMGGAIKPRIVDEHGLEI